MAKLKLVQVGCGGMGLRHVYGQIELRRQGFDTFELVAVCDIQQAAAEHVASKAGEGLRVRPRIYNRFEEMLEKERPDAVDVVTDTRFHHVYAIGAFDAGAHVAVEKPMGLTVQACHRMIDAARRTGKVLSVSENYRRDPMNRLLKALIENKVLGEPRLVVDINLNGNRDIQQVAAWRHMKLRGGYVVEYGVHNSDLLLYFMGELDTLYAQTHLWEKLRYMTDKPRLGVLGKFYSHRVDEAIDKAGSIECTAEDMALALLRFKSGAQGQMSMSNAASGESTDASIIYFNDGSLKLPGSRSGDPVQLTRLGGKEYLSGEEVLKLVPEFRLDTITAPFFNGQRRISSYSLDFDDIDRKLVAIEMQDFGEAILTGREPEVNGRAGLEAVALSYAVLESGYLGQPVSLTEIKENRINSYQKDINDSIPL